MKLYDPALSKNNVGRTEPPKTAHSGAANPWVSCASDIYEEVWADIMGEIANAITGAGITLDGTKRNQLLSAIQALAPSYVENVQTVGSGTGNQGATGVDLSAAPFNVPATAKSVQLAGFLLEGANDRGTLIEIVSGASNAIPLAEILVNAAPSIQRTTAFISVDPSKSITFEIKKSPTSIAGNNPTWDILMLGYT